jgi:glucokinase
VADAARTLLESRGLVLEDLAGIGVGCAGLIDTGAGVLKTSPNLPAWRDVPVRALLEARFSRPVHLANDAAAFLHAEWQYGAARAAANALFVTVGTGVGGGLVLDGRVFRGPTGLGGEIGHVSIDVDGPECPCGNRGCLELYVGRAAIERRARDAGFPPESWSPAAVAERAAGGDAAALRIYEEVGIRLGRALAGFVNLLEPEVIVIGGGIAASSSLLFPAAARELKARSMVARQKSIPLLGAHFGPAAGMIGAALLGADRGIAPVSP